MPEIFVKFGREASASADSSKALRGQKPGAGVTGQAATVSIVCWNCWAVNEVVMPGPGEDFTFVCWNCGTVAAI